MITINEIAKKAGVAKSTVSRYLNEGSVSEKTKKKIAKIIEETDYQPNLYAQSLKAKSSKMIGVVIPRLNSASTNDALTGIDSEAKKNGYEPVFLNSNLKIDNDIKNIQILNKQKVEGIIFFARELTNELIKVIQESKVPIILVGQTLKGSYSVTHKDYEAGYKMGEYLSQMGHQRVLFMGVSEKDKAVGVNRKQGFNDAFEKEEGESYFLETSFSKRKTYQLVIEELPNYFDQEITAIVCATDNIAIAVAKGLTDLGKSIPNDFSLTGFGGYDITSYFNPSITTVRYPYQDIGKTAVKHLLKQVKNKNITAKNIELVNELIIQASVKRINKE